jgi:hypothetical protein
VTDKHERYSGDDEVIERNVERSREVIEARKRSENEGKARKPTQDDPNRVDESAAPNQWDVPAGGQSGPNVQGGSTRRHKP